MTSERAEPFSVALGSLRARLRRGEFGFEQRLAASEIAEALRLSPTPVREALARLAGEGLLEDRRGQGYFVLRPGAADVADLYRLNLAHLLIALEPGRRIPAPPRPEGAPDPLPGEDPVAGAEALFERWVTAAGSRALVQSFGPIQARLAPLRRLEPLVLVGLGDELAGLVAAASPERQVLMIRRFHRRRIRVADRLAGLLQVGPPSEI